jgi:hypothetical protein
MNFEDFCSTIHCQIGKRPLNWSRERWPRKEHKRDDQFAVENSDGAHWNDGQCSIVQPKQWQLPGGRAMPIKGKKRRG